MFVDFKSADKDLFFLFENLHHFGLRLGSATACGYGDFHFVAVEGAHGVAFGHEDHFAVGVGYH